MSGHTPEPWRIGLCGVDAETNPIENDNGMVHITEAHPDDARRIVACVNACVGASTEDLEKHGFLALRGRQVAAIERQRDELLAAMKMIEHATEPSHDDGAYHENAYSIASAAISKVKPWP